MFWYFLFMLVQCSVSVLCFSRQDWREKVAISACTSINMRIDEREVKKGLSTGAYYVWGFEPEKPCEIQDIECINTIVRGIFQSAVIGNKELGVEVLDPMRQELIEGNLQDVKYHLSDCFVFGFKDTKLNEVKLITLKDLRIDITIPQINITGNYKIEGKLLNLPVEGEGNIFLNATNVHMVIDSKKVTSKKDGITYLKLTDIQTKTELLGTLHMDLKNLFKGNKELAETVLKFINTNPKIVADLWQDPLVTATISKIFDNVNEILTKIPLEDLVVPH